MNTHLNTFHNYKEDENPIENNLTRAFLVTLKNEPLLGHAFFCQITGEYPWDGLNFGLQEGSIDISGFDRIIGLALTTGSLTEQHFLDAEAAGTDSPRPDFFIYTGKTLVVGEVKKHSENPIAQLKNQVGYLLRAVDEDGYTPRQEYKALTWTDVVSTLVVPYEERSKREGKSSCWASDFRDYIEAHYTDWLPVPTLDKIDLSAGSLHTAKRLVERRLYAIQSLTDYGAPEYWVGGRSTMSLQFGWATEAMVKLEQIDNKPFVCITIWPGDTKHQGWKIFHKDLCWAHATSLQVGVAAFPLKIAPYIKFAHVMGKGIAGIEFHDEDREQGLAFHTAENFHRYAGMWRRDDWPELDKLLTKDFCDSFDWHNETAWEENFVNSNRSYVFVSLGFQSNIFIPYEKLQAAERNDSTGNTAARLIMDTIQNFRGLVDGTHGI